MTPSTTRVLRGAVGLLMLAGLCYGQDLHVMRDGDTKIFTGGNGTSRTIEGIDDYYGWTRMSGHPLGDGWYRNYTSSGDTWITQWTGALEGVIKVNASVGESWGVAALDQCLQNGTVTLQSTGNTLYVPAGTFDDCKTYTFVGNCNDAGPQSMTFAPGVGVISWIESSIAGPVRYDLESATIGGTQYPAPFEGVKISTRLDRTSYTEGSTQKIRITAKLINETSATVDLHHSSGKMFDVTIAPLNDPQNILAQWSYGRFFTMAFVHRAVAAGDTLTYTIEMDLQDNQDVDLPAGTYLLHWYSTGGAYGGKTTFEIEP